MPVAARTVSLRVLDTDLDLVCPGVRADEVADALLRCWALALAPVPREPQVRVEVALLPTGASPPGISDPERGRVAGEHLDRLLVTTTHAVTYAVIAAQTGSLLMLHAGVVAHPVTGAAAVLVAPGGTGKTTACRTLGLGRGYLTDETAGVRHDGTIAPYPKPLSVRRPSGDVKDEVDPRAVGLRLPAVTASVVAVVLLDRRDDAGDEPEVTPLDPFAALTDLAPETSALDRLDRPLRRLHDLGAGVDLLARVTYAEASDLQPLLTDLIGAPTPGSG